MRFVSVVLPTAVAVGIVAMSYDPVAARIGLNDAEMLAGLLVVSGRTSHRYETVTLDGHLTAKSDRHRRFVFRVPYYPPSCTVEIKTAHEARTAAVASCGASGSNGATGPRGPEGPQGPQGIAGPRGATGPIGPTGATGPQGPQGVVGATGPIGPQGPQGSQGIPGPVGAVGPQGPQGVPGPSGPAGVPGPQGSQGVAGAAGPPGPVGAAGPQGPQGVAGLTGAAGPQGPKGDTDATVMRIRQVGQDCIADHECAVACAAEEIAINAYCPKKAAAILMSLREISCGDGNAATMVAFCAR